MTEHQWLTTSNPWGLIDFVGPKASARKFRLFACACCRQVLNPFVSRLVVGAVTAAEAFADREISADTLTGIREVVAQVVIDADREGTHRETPYFDQLLRACLSVCHPGNAAESAQDTSHATASAAADVQGVRYATQPAERSEELAVQADLFRDIFGNPFRSSEIQLEWLTDTVGALARGIYADRAFDRMPILADALQDAGCDDDDVLNHCREPREHVRGCWVVDLLLGKG